ITSAGRCTCSIVNAIVAVLPLPVTPRSVWKRSPSLSPSDSSLRAFGWSATGRYAGLSSNCGMLLFDASNRGSRSDEDRDRRRRTDRRQPRVAVGKAAALRDAVLLARAGEPRAARIRDRCAGVRRLSAGGRRVRRGGAVLGAVDARRGGARGDRGRGARRQG